MDITEILKKIRKIEIRTRGLSRQVFAGDYQSTFKGRGMIFSEVKDYHYGDDVRNIDWNVTARFNSPFVKVFEEEREMVVMLVLDVSGSGEFGTTTKSKKDLMVEMAAVLGFSAAANNDKVGAIFVSDEIEKFIPPQKGRGHVLMILKQLIALKPKSKGTNIAEGLKYLRGTLKKRCTAVLISDFMDENDFVHGVKLTNKKHDLVALRLKDPSESILPKMGIIQLYDAEKGIKRWVNTNLKSIRQKYENQFLKFENELEERFRKSGVDYVTLSTHGDYVTELNKLFTLRSK